MPLTPPQPDMCNQPPSLTLLAAVRQFNAGDYFICHETLEVLWLAEEGPVRNVYQGILQIGIGLLHLQRGNEPGARALLERGAQRLQPFLPVCLGLDLAALHGDTTKILAQLNAPAREHPLQLVGTRPRITLIETKNPVVP